MALFWRQKTSLKTEKDSRLSQNIIYFDKTKRFWKLMICFCYFCQIFFSVLGVAYNDPFSVQITHKETIFTTGKSPIWRPTLKLETVSRQSPGVARSRHIGDAPKSGISNRRVLMRAPNWETSFVLKKRAWPVHGHTNILKTHLDICKT